MIAANRNNKAKRYGMTIDVDRCTGCGACMVACAVENNVPPAHEGATERKGITWIRVFKVDNGEDYPASGPCSCRCSASSAAKTRPACMSARSRRWTWTRPLAS